MVQSIGSVLPREAGHHNEQADVFLIPTHSDGFDLTQLEVACHSSNLGQAVAGDWRGFLDILALRTIRSPVTTPLYRVHRCLKKLRLLALDDLAAVLPPISTKGAS